MKPRAIYKTEAFTRIELIVVIVVAFVLLSVFIPVNNGGQKKATRLWCVNNLKVIGTAYRIWSNDNGDRFPASQSVTNSGWSELLTRANDGFMCWLNYSIMSNELGQSTRVLVCPADERKPADDFSNFVSNIHLSYFVGVSSDDTYPQSLLGGDRNLGSGNKPNPLYGFSPENGQGNDVAIQTNSKTGPVHWSLKMHSGGNSVGVGNILLGDGSVQQVTSGSLGLNWQPHFDPTTNWPAGHVPTSPSIRVLFP